VKPIFEIIDGDKHYKVYANGEIEGFGKDATIINSVLAAILTYHENQEKHDFKEFVSI